MNTWLCTDLSMRQFVTLLALRDAGKLKMMDIADLFGISSPSVTGIVHRLRARGLVSVNHDSLDERVRWVCLTTQGDELLATMIAEVTS